MTLTSPFGVAEGGDGQTIADKNATDALHKLQTDYTTLVAQAAEQNQQNLTTLVSQAREQNLTTLVSQAREQNLTTLVSQAREQNPPNGTPLVGQAREQTQPNYLTLVEQARQRNPLNYTTLIAQAMEVNPQDSTTPATQSAERESRRTTLVEQAREQNSDKPAMGINQFFKDDIESTLIANVGQVLARGYYQKEENFKALLKQLPKDKLHLGTVGDIPATDEVLKNFWHSSNDKADVSKLVSNSETAYKMEPKPVVAALAALQQQIDANLLSARTGTPMTAEQRDRTRQMIENAAMIEMAIARSKGTDNADAKDLVWGEGQSVNNLVKLATKFGVNADNIAQLKKMMQEFPH